MLQNLQSGSTLRDAFRILFRHKGKVSLFFLAVMAAVTLYTTFAPRVYRSEGKLFVRLGRENVVLDATSTLGHSPVVAVPDSREDEMNTLVEILNSRVLTEKVVDAIGPAAILGREAVTSHPPQIGAQPSAHDADRNRAILHVRRNLGVEVVLKTNVVVISYEDPNPVLSREVVAKMMTSYLDEHARLNRTPRAFEFLSNEISSLRRQLTGSEDELRNLKNETGLVSAEEQRRLIVQRIARLQDELLQTESTLSASQVEVRELQKTLSNSSRMQVTADTAGLANGSVDGTRRQLYELKIKEKEVLAKYTELHPFVRQVREQIAAAEAIVREEEGTRTQVTRGPSRVYEETQLALLNRIPLLASLEAKTDTLHRQLADSREELKTLNTNELRIAKLQREVQLQEASYRKYWENLEQARIDQSLDQHRISNINVVQPATTEIKPVSPKPLLNLALGLFVGVFGGLGIALAAENLDHSFKTPEEIEQRLGLPTLVSIPRVDRVQMELKGMN